MPESENIPALAEHGSSMVLFLSAGMLPALREDLLKGAYTEETPAAIVFRASWPEETVIRCTVGTMAELARDSGIHSTALVLVGDFLAPDQDSAGRRYERSRLYDPAFTTGFRKGEEQV